MKLVYGKRKETKRLFNACRLTETVENTKDHIFFRYIFIQEMKKQKPTLSNQYPFLFYIFSRYCCRVVHICQKKKRNSNVVISVKYKFF